MIKYVLLILISFLVLPLKAQEKTALEMAQKQLDAYNARDIDAFVACYAEDVQVYNFPDKLIMEGREKMRESYGRMFQQVPNLHCELVNRISIGNKVIDREKVTGFPDGKVLQALAIYFVEDNLIKKVYFISE